MPFVGNVSFLATPRPDSTHVIFGVSLSNSALTFSRENDRFRAGYTVSVVLADGPVTVKQIEAHESVLVASFKETSRIDASVIYQDLVTLKPGRYRLTLTVRDDGSSKSSTEDVTLAVPTLGPGTLGTPIAFAEVAPRVSVDSFPRVIANPASTITFGRDSLIALYIEGYDTTARARMPLQVAVRTEKGKTLFTDTISIAHRVNMYSGVLYIRTARIGIGPTMISVWQPGRTDTTQAPIFIGFGEDLPVAGYEEMINYLRWFAPAYKLQALRDTAPEFRPAAWAAFVKQYQTPMGTSDALHDYFRRLLDANNRFREEGIPGWQTDRGKVLLALGEPDQLYEQPMTVSQRSRTQIWEYRNDNLQLVFLDQTGFGRWRLTASSEIAFDGAWQRHVR